MSKTESSGKRLSISFPLEKDFFQTHPTYDEYKLSQKLHPKQKR